MVFPVHLQRSAVAAILDCPVRRQFTGPESLKPVAPQVIWLFQESRVRPLKGARPTCGRHSLRLASNRSWADPHLGSKIRLGLAMVNVSAQQSFTAEECKPSVRVDMHGACSQWIGGDTRTLTTSLLS